MAFDARLQSIAPAETEDQTNNEQGSDPDESRTGHRHRPIPSHNPTFGTSQPTPDNPYL